MIKKNIKQSPEHIKKRTEARLKTMKEKYPDGITPWNKGLSKETNNKIKEASKKVSKTLKEKYNKEGFIHWMKIEKNNEVKKRIVKNFKNNQNRKGNPNSPSEETRSKIKNSLKLKHKKGEIKIWNKGKSSWCKGLNKFNSEDIKKRSLKIKQSKKGKKFEEKHKENLRKSILNRVLRQGVFIAYNEKSIPFFKMLNEKYNLKGIFGKDEFKCIGYSLDFYSSEHNLVIEWDEKFHYNNDEQLKERDIIRQKRITNHLNCEFIRIKQWEDLTKYEELIKLFIVNNKINYLLKAS